MSSDLKLLHVVGSRPQFPKLASVSRAIQDRNRTGESRIEESILHTGQHYDHELSRVFFEELGIPAPDHNLGIGSGDHALQTAAGIQGIHQVLEDAEPQVVLVYGDTNATLAGALAALQRRHPVGHVEAGVRTGNLFQAEELNRVVADRVAAARYCCTEHNLDTLAKEGLSEGSCFTGDTMLDNWRYFLPRMDQGSLERLQVGAGEFILCTIHRAENTDHPVRLGSILDAIIQIQREIKPVVFPMHPRTQKALAGLGREGDLERGGVRVIESQGFHVLQALIEQCHCVLSDSGGVQREAYFSGKRCVVPWEYACWVELAESGWALTGTVEAQAVVGRVASAPGPCEPEQRGLFGAGDAGEKIVSVLIEQFG